MTMQRIQHSEGIEIFLNTARNTARSLGKLGVIEAAKETFEDGLREGLAERQRGADVNGAHVAPMDRRYQAETLRAKS